LQETWPEEYIGKEVHGDASKPWPQVFVRWSWSDNWTPGNSDGTLFWSPTALFGGSEGGIPIYDFGLEKISSERLFVRTVMARVEVSV